MGSFLKDILLTDAGGTASEIVTVEDVKTYLQIEGDAYNGPIGVFITAARMMVETMCGVSLYEKEAIATIQSTGRNFTLPYGPVQSISLVRWKKCPSTWVTLTEPDDYGTYGNNRVTIESSEVGLHEVTYTLGVDPRGIFVQAVTAQAGFMFNNRDMSDKPAPEVKALLAGYMEIT